MLLLMFVLRQTYLLWGVQAAWSTLNSVPQPLRRLLAGASAREVSVSTG